MSSLMEMANKIFLSGDYFNSVILYNEANKLNPMLKDMMDFNMGLAVNKLGHESSIMTEINDALFPKPIPNKVLLQAHNLMLKGYTNEGITFAIRNLPDSVKQSALLLMANKDFNNDHLWLSKINMYLQKTCGNIFPIQLAHGGDDKFFRIVCNCEYKIDTGPLISIIMPAYNAEETIELSIKSILNQTWQKIELIVIDDFSSDKTWEIISSLAKSDNRIKPLRNISNIGPYASKNIALKFVNGEYVTGHDADDWAHPQRIELHIKEMLSQPLLPASMIKMLRMNSDGFLSGISFIHSNTLDGAMRGAMISCMVKTQYLRSVLGGWDTVRVGADSELENRIERITGSSVPRFNIFGMFCLNSASGLTSHSVYGRRISVEDNGIVKSITSPARKDYAKAYSDWHQTINLKTAFVKFPLESRLFPVPEEIRIDSDLLAKVLQAHDVTREDTPCSSVKLNTSFPMRNIFNDYSKIIDKCGVEKLIATLMEYGIGKAGRDILLYYVSDGKLSYNNFLIALEMYRDISVQSDGLQLLSCIDVESLLLLANLLAKQRLENDDAWNALSLYNIGLSLYGKSIFTKNDSKLYVEIAIYFKKYELAEQLINQLPLFDSQRELLSMDIYRLQLDDSAFKKWYKQFNKFFSMVDTDSAKCFLDTESFKGAYFNSLSAKVTKYISDGDLVSIIMPSYCPGREIFTAIKSLINQTWTNIEILLIDDASPDSYNKIYEECINLDSRVKLIRLKENAGTYVARNSALLQAKGKYVTFLDFDDWSHPRRIELQVEFMMQNSQFCACMGYGVRVNDDLTAYSFGKGYDVECATLFFFDRNEVINKVGFYDNVRKGADTEYILRLEKIFGYKLPIMGNDLILQLYRTNSNSLSSEEFKPGWRHPSCTVYRESYTYWHEHTDVNDLYLKSDNEERKFFAPLSFINAEKPQYDVIFIGDWISLGGPQHSMLEEIKALHKANLKLAICSLQPLRFMSRKAGASKISLIQKMINDGRVDEVTLEDTLDAKIVILRYPLLMQFVSFEKSNWNIGKGFILVNQANSENDGSDIRYIISDCTRTIKNTFAIDFTWIPMGPLVRRKITPLISPFLLENYDCPGILDIKDWKTKLKPVSNVPVIGRYSRDNHYKFPSEIEQMEKIYLANHSNVKVRMMGAVRVCNDMFGEQIPTNWEIIRHKSMPVKKFLASIDFFVYFDNESIVEAFCRSILEAAASGKVVILSHKFAEVFGDAAIYAEPAQVESIVMDLYYDQSKYKKYSDKALQHVKNIFSHESYLTWINGILEN
ncbi:MAG: glycosyltransferase [Burkholderiales bacterium]|nr:glycosyltransferase [Burkholderiales bacterium]